MCVQCLKMTRKRMTLTYLLQSSGEVNNVNKQGTVHILILYKECVTSVEQNRIIEIAQNETELKSLLFSAHTFSMFISFVFALRFITVVQCFTNFFLVRGTFYKLC